MNARPTGIWIMAAGLLLGAETASASDGDAGDTGGPPPPAVSAAVARATAAAVYFGASATPADAWAGDTGGGPPPTAHERRNTLASSPQNARGGAARLETTSGVLFTDRG